jgi:hypothetical protein
MRKMRRQRRQSFSGDSMLTIVCSGIAKSDPPYTELEVVGTTISDRVKVELSQFGFNSFQLTAEGFRAVRPVRLRHRVRTKLAKNRHFIHDPVVSEIA